MLNNFGDPSGGSILLLSNGENNDPNFPTNDLMNSLVDAGVIVNSIAFSQSADNQMAILAVATGT